MATEEEYVTRLQEDPGDESFAEFAEYLRLQGRHQEGIIACVAGLSANPSFHRGRLALARLFFECGYHPFAIKELRELRAALPDNIAIQRLEEVLSRNERSEATAAAAGGIAGAVGNSSDSSAKPEVTVAETDFDIDDL